MYDYYIGYHTIEANIGVSLHHEKEYTEDEVSNIVTSAAREVIRTGKFWIGITNSDPTFPIRISDVFHDTIGMMVSAHGFIRCNYQVVWDQWDIDMRDNDD